MNKNLDGDDTNKLPDPEKTLSGIHGVMPARYGSIIDHKLASSVLLRAAGSSLTGFTFVVPGVITPRS